MKDLVRGAIALGLLSILIIALIAIAMSLFGGSL